MKIFTKFIASILLIAIGYIIGSFSSTTIHDKKQIKDSSYILKELISHENTYIQEKNIHCELFDDNNQILTKVKVSNYLQKYLQSSMYHRTKNFHDNIKCGEKGKGICSLSYGDKVELNKGSSSSLFFEYDSKNKSINPKSFECIDIP